MDPWSQSVYGTMALLLILGGVGGDCTSGCSDTGNVFICLKFSRIQSQNGHSRGYRACPQFFKEATEIGVFLVMWEGETNLDSF